MLAQRVEILDQLAKHGWDAVPVERHELEWWADEMWLLTSNWSPVGSTAYLTFMVDPMYGAPDRKKGESVWAALASIEKPDGRMPSADSFELSLNQGWKERLPGLLKHLNGWRNERGAEEFDGS